MCILKGALPQTMCKPACANFNDNVLFALLPKVLSAMSTMSTQVSSLLVISEQHPLFAHMLLFTAF